MSERVVVRLHAAHLTIEPPPGFETIDEAVALVAFPGGEVTVVIAGTVDELRKVADGLNGYLDDVACTCVGEVRPDCPTHGGDE